MSGKGVGCKLHTSAHFNQLATPTRNNSSLHTRTHGEIPEISGKVSVCIMHRAMDARHAHKALFHMGDARSLAPNSDPHVCKRFRFLRLGGRMHPRVSGRFLSFVNSFVFFRSKPAPFLRLGYLQCKVTFPAILAPGALAALSQLRLWNCRAVAKGRFKTTGHRGLQQIAARCAPTLG